MSTITKTYADVVTGAQATIAAYAQALDAAQMDDVVELFCADGVFEMPGATAQGPVALRQVFGGFVSEQPWRHVMINTLVTEWNGDEVKASSDLLVVQRGDAGWAIQIVGRYQDVLHHVDGKWLFHNRTLTFVN